MPISPGKDETQSEWMDRCASEMANANPDWDNDRVIAACSQMWRDRDKASLKPASKQPEPDDDESYQDFMDRCMETDDEETCQVQWDERGASRTVVVDKDGTTMRKTHVGHNDGAEYILSDESVDRMGDIIEAAGWRVDNFKRNPIALFGHRSDFIIGTWKNIRIENKQLRAHLALAPPGTSDRIDEIRRLVEAGILKATSVGFKPLKYEAIDKEAPWDGVKFLEQELVETSLVSVPANPNALAVAKGLDVSRETLALVFGKQADKGNGARLITRGINGKHAGDDAPPHRKAKTMSTAQTIVEAQGQLNILRDSLSQHLATLDNDDVNDDQMKKTDDLNVRIAKKKRFLDQLVESEKALGNATAGNGADPDPHAIHMPPRRIDPPAATTARTYAEVKAPYKPGDHMFKALVCLVKMQGDRYRKSSALDVLRDTVGENDKVRAVFDHVIGKAAAVPALTTTVGWAAELVRTDIQGFLEQLTPASVAAKLIAKGVSFNFGTNGIISIPMRSATPTIAGSFVGEGAPIPVRQGAFSAVQLIPKKVAVITTYSREISEHSDPAIEGILRDAITVDTAVAIDSVLMDANPATAVRPAGLRNGVTTLTPTAGGGFAAVVGDVKLLAGALLTSTLGNVRNPVWLMGPNLSLALRLTVAPNGTLVFAEEMNRGTFMGWPVIESPNVTADTLFLIDAADFISASGDPRFDVSDQATVHMEDTTPAQIVPGPSGPASAPVRSFWQTDTLGLRMIMQLNWAFRRPAMIAYITAVTWK